jgi:uncharacterized protein (DUF924 family)
MSLTIQHQPGRFSATVEGEPLEVDYQVRGEQLVFTHTGTAPALQGRGLAAQMVEHALAWAAQQGKQVVPACSYVDVYIRRHAKWQRLLAPAAAQQVLNFWFGALGSAEDGQVRAVWFKKDAAFDAGISTRFGTVLDEALATGMPNWQATPHGRLATLVLLDQFTRNSFRGEPRSFAGDALALPLALDLLTEKGFTPLERWFALMPLEHAEDLELQQRVVTEFEALAAIDKRIDGALDFARRHRDVIQRFGRFPHRNAILGRASSAEELAYLAQPGAGF